MTMTLGDVFVPMYGDSFFTSKRDGRKIHGTAWSFRPHVWGFFFHDTNFPTKAGNVTTVFVPMYGDSFFTFFNVIRLAGYQQTFSSPCMGILFSQWNVNRIVHIQTEFSSPCMGILFSPHAHLSTLAAMVIVFVPMYGDSFFT